MHRSRMKASEPRCVLYGSIPRTHRAKMAEGDREWKGPRVGFVAIRFRRNRRNRSLFRKNGPEMHISSQRTIQKLLGNDRSKSPKQVVFCVNNNGFGAVCHFGDFFARKIRSKMPMKTKLKFYIHLGFLKNI